jgi:TonB-linked SusC/RagA family outer membrane protein
MRILKKWRFLGCKKALYMIIISLFGVINASAQNISVKGLVKDESGNVISKALIQFGNQTDSTDVNGSFSLTASKGEIISITKQGYSSRRIKATKSILVVLKSNIEIKNISLLYQTLASREVTSSVSTVESKSLSNNYVLAFGNALYGKLAGLNLRQADGEPGDDYPSILIRGKHSFTGNNSPLVLVDGFEREYNTLSVDEVESVSVLKDAASTALYGMDGANGVLLVKTKRGLDGMASVGLKIETGYRTPTRLPKFYGSYDYARFYNQAQSNDGKTSFLYSDTQLEEYRLNQNPKLYPNIDWFNETIRKYSPTQRYILDFRGGNTTAKYYVNVGVDNSEGLFKNTDHKAINENGPSYSTNRNLDRVNFRSNIDINVTKRLSVSLDLAGRLETINSPTNSTASIFNILYTFHPNVTPVFVANGIYGGNNTYRNNPVAYINEQGYTSTHRRNFQSNISAKYNLSNLLKGLTTGVRATFDNFYSSTDGYKKTYSVRQIFMSNLTGKDSIGVPYGTDTNLANIGVDSDKELRSNNVEFFTEYNRTFGKHKVSALALYHKDEYITSLDFPDKRISVAGKMSYGFNNRYFIDMVAQYGATENFKKGKRFGLFPAISGAWIMSEENFMKEFNPITFLKLRFSSGLVGNQNVGGTRFGYLTLYNANGSEQLIGNENLSWEKAYKTDFGIDISLYKDIDLNITSFNEFRHDILNSGSNLLPSYFGNAFGNTNYGQVYSSGWEFTLALSHDYLNWGYHISAVASNIATKITRIKEVPRQWNYLYQQGNPLGQRYGLIAEGLFQSQAEIDASPIQSYGKVIPGSIKYKDINDDGVINNDDYVAIGKDATIPTWDLGFNIGFNIKSFYMDANFQGAVGRDVNLRSDSEGAQYSVTPIYGDKNVSTYVKNPWTVETAATADFPSLSIENSANNYTPTSTYWLRNGDFIRLRSMEVGYNLPKAILNSIGLSTANIYVRGMNLFTLDHIRYFDPEVMEGYPVMKSYSVGLNIKY